jgi:2-amino-4-hydroxy-6-hydroxymethyldihydropteridine diphosphokinase
VSLAAIALGSNLSSRFGGSAETLCEALRRLGDLGTVTAVSSFHRTAPVGFLEQPDFVNAAASLETHLRPLALLHALLEIEQAMGRDRSATVPPKGPRVVDLDLLLYDDLVLAGPELTLPHPEMHKRRFVLEPLTEIAPAWVHPGSGLTVSQLLEHCKVR